jgi:murein DD-endopeptidase MepM/ murein hydrolase activator NlpD
MRVYHGNQENQRRKLSKKALLSIGISVALIATAVILTITLTNKPNDLGIVAPPVGNTPAYTLPVEDSVLGFEFSNTKLIKHKTDGNIYTHEAVDFLVENDAKIKSVFDGTVQSIDLNTTMEGSVVKIQHANGVVSIYKGLSTVDVNVGDSIKGGAVIGTIGNMPVEAREYEQPHLHFEITKDGKLDDPFKYLPELGEK